MLVGRPDQRPRSVDPAAVPPAIALDDSSVIEDAWLGRVAAADGLFVVDERQRIVSWSSSAQRLLGYSPEEVTGQPCYLVLMGREPNGHPVCRLNCQVTANARRGRGTASYEVAARSRDGVVKYVRNSVLVLKGAAKTFRVLHLFHETNAAPVAERRAPTSARHEREERASLIEHLTRRELEVLRLLAAGSATDEIGQALDISMFTARNHIANIQRKLGARNRLEIVLLATRGGLI